VIFGGRVVAEIDAADADEATLLRAAYNLRSDARMPEDLAAEAVAADIGESVDLAVDEPAPPGARP
jgi:hypothetical protein